MTCNYALKLGKCGRQKLESAVRFVTGEVRLASMCEQIVKLRVRVRVKVKVKSQKSKLDPEVGSVMG